MSVGLSIGTSAFAQSQGSTQAEPKAQPALAEPAVAANPESSGSASASSDLDVVVDDKPLRKPPESTRWLLIGVGAGTTGLWYAGALGVRELWPDAPGETHLRYPVAGPFVDLYHTGCPASDSNCSTFQLVVRTVLVSLDAIGQVGGVALILQGAVLGTAGAEAPRPNSTARLRRLHEPALLPVPWVDGRGGGLSLVGRF